MYGQHYSGNMKRNQTFALDIGWQPLLRDLGISVSHVLRRAGLPEDRFSHQARGLTSDASLLAIIHFTDHASVIKF